LAVSAAEMCIGGRLGMTLQVETPEQVLRPVNGCLLVEVSPEDCGAFESSFRALPDSCIRLGHTTAEPVLSIGTRNRSLVSLPVTALVAAWKPQSDDESVRADQQT
jgi:hypothetical protein